MTHDHCAHDHALLETAIDPVCGMTVTVAGAKNSTVHEGRPYYFCNPKCLAKFSADHKRYLKPAAVVPPEKPIAQGTMFTCPMHPEVRQIGPGSCPICGMALEPEQVSLDQGPNEELVDMTRRLWIGGALAVPVVVLDMGGATFIDSTALGVVIRAADQLRGAGKQLFVVAPDGPVSRLLELTNLKQHFTVYSDRDEAISAASVAAS